ncbi:MAG: hypothetical protein ACRD2L_18250 [Terriglobia bacterium]
MLTSKRKAHLIIIATFILGIMVGASGQYLLFHQSVPQRPPSPSEVANELTRILRLDQLQRTQLEQILSEHRQQYQEYKSQTQLHYTAMRDDARNRIRALLSADQKALYDQWTREMDLKREKKKSEEGK